MPTKVGSFIKSTNTSVPVTQDIALPFDPNSILIFATQATSSDAIEDSHGAFAIGAYDGTNEKSLHMNDQDGVGTSDTARIMRSSRIITFLNPLDDTVLAQGNITISGGKFTITWTTNNAVGYIINYMATTIRGEVGTFQRDVASPPGTQTISTTNVGKAIIIFSSPVQVLDVPQTGLFHCIGFADGTRQCCEQGSCLNNVGTADTERSFATDELIRVSAVSTIIADAQFGGFNTGPNGFDINWLTGDASPRFYHYFMPYEGTWEVVTGTTKTSAGTKAYTTTQEPDAVIFLSSVVATLDTFENGMSMGFGASDGVNEAGATISSQDGVATTVTKRASYSTDGMVALDPDNSALLFQARVDGFNATDVTMDFQGTPSATARHIGMLVMTDPVGVPGSGMFSGIIGGGIV